MAGTCQRLSWHHSLTCTRCDRKQLSCGLKVQNAQPCVFTGVQSPGQGLHNQHHHNCSNQSTLCLPLNNVYNAYPGSPTAQTLPKPMLISQTPPNTSTVATSSLCLQAWADGILAFPYWDLPFTRFGRALKARQQLLGWLQVGLTLGQWAR